MKVSMNGMRKNLLRAYYECTPNLTTKQKEILRDAVNAFLFVYDVSDENFSDMSNAAIPKSTVIEEDVF